MIEPGRTVLICDDEVHIRAVLRRRFESRGWCVVEASDGVEAVEQAAAARPVAIVIDYQMPRMNGVEAVRGIAADPALAATPVLMLTGRGHKIPVEELERTGVRAVLPKPFSASEVVDLVLDLVPAAAGGPRPRPTPDAEAERSVTRALDFAYESIDLLYRLCNRMTLADDAAELCDQAIEGLLSVTGYRRVALAFGDDPRVLGELAGVVRLRSGDVDDDHASGIELRRAVASGWRGLLDAATDGIAVATDGPLRGEVVICGIRVDETPAAGLAAFGGRQPWAAARGDASSEDRRAVEAVGSVLSSTFENRRLFREQTALFAGTLTALTGALDAKDPYTRGHSERVALLAGRLAAAIGFDARAAARVTLAGRLHDIGKIGVPDRVLLKPERLSDEDFAIIKTHPVIGYEMLRSIPALGDILAGVRSHHERWDGGGYPDGLAGDAIDPIARLLAVADTFDAMSSNRAYRSSRPRETVLAEIERNAGRQFDPSLVDPFLALDFGEFDALKALHERSSAGRQRAA